MMKKFYSLMLVVLSLFSCFVFSACGDKYKKLSMNFYSSDGTKLTVAEFMIDTTKESSSKTLGVEFKGVDKDDIGEIVVYSEPSELVTATNYNYDGKMCYVDINPNMSSGENAKLIVKHLASGKKKEIGLKIDQKSTGLNLVNSKYVLDVYKHNEESYNIDFTKLISLYPSGSSDQVFFKFVDSSTVDNAIKAISLTDVEGYEDVFTGFEVPANVENLVGKSVQIYPVTYMKGYKRGETDPYQNKIITIYFDKSLTDESVSLKNNEEIDNNDIVLIANDDNYKTLKTSFIYDEELLSLSHYFDFYGVEIDTNSDHINSFADTNHDVFTTVLYKTSDYVDVKISLIPKVPGNLSTVEKFVKIKGELKADRIQIYKNESEEPLDINEPVNIFDYYEEATSLGTMFNFVPVAASQGEVSEDLKYMQIMVDPRILSNNNTTYESVNTMLYALEFKVVTRLLGSAEYLNFEYDNTTHMMVSDAITKNTDIYIKYIDGGGRVEPEKLEISVVMKQVETWSDMERAQVSIGLHPIKGVTAMDLGVGYYKTGLAIDYVPVGDRNPEYVYLDTTKGINNEEVDRVFLDVINESVKGNSSGTNTEFTTEFSVEVVSLSGEVTNPLKICNGVEVIENASTFLEYTYDWEDYKDVIALVFDSNTTIGVYEIIFKQENIKKASVKCCVYKGIEELNDEMISFETNKYSFANVEYTHLYDKAQYIVASGQKLNLSLNLPNDVVDSNMINDYEFGFEIEDSAGVVFEEDTTTEKPVLKSDFFGYKPLANEVELDFKKGTFIDDKPQYIKLTINVYFKTVADLTRLVDEPTPISISVYFFIYDLIENDDLSISDSSLTRYVKEFMSAYHEEQSKALIQVNMVENLWNYTTGGQKVRWTIDNQTIAFVDNANDKEVIENNGAIITENQFNCCDLQFKTIEVMDGWYRKTIKAYVEQFNNIFELECVVFVEQPILTEKLNIVSPVYYDDAKQNYYINLKNGGEYQVEAFNYSSLGEVTNSGTVIQIVDEFGSAAETSEYFTINRTLSKISVDKVDTKHNFKLIIYAKDVLKERIDAIIYGYNNPSSFIMNDFGPKFNFLHQNRYLNAYFVIDIHLSDGSEETPYEIHSADDFWEIDDTEEYRNAYYKLMSSINLENTSDKNEKVIRDFCGSLIADEVYTVDGITLTAKNKNLFVGFKKGSEINSGTIKNIRFIVDYQYLITDNQSAEVHLGLFDRNRGTLENVQVQVADTSNIELNGRAKFFFGALAGVNEQFENSNGDISAGVLYTNTSGVSGKVEISGDATIYVGGLVGKNIYQICGNEPAYVTQSGNRIELVSTSGGTHAISSLEIKATKAITGAIGGVIGLNTYSGETQGVLKNVFVKSKIIAENSSNVGGVIGENNQRQSAIKMELDSNAVVNIATANISEMLATTECVYNVKSASTIKGNYNVGGIVGVDTNGVYVLCDYQVLKSSIRNVAILGNHGVGGIAGTSTSGKFAFCSVMSYNWNYSKLSSSLSTVISGVEDIYGTNHVGGIVGNSVSSANGLSIGENDVNNRVVVVSSSVNAYLKLNNEDANNSNIGGILSTEAGYAVVYNAYFIGKLENVNGEINYLEKTIQNPNTSLNENHYLALDNNNQATKSYINYVYSFNIHVDNQTVQAKIGSMQGDDAYFEIKNNSELEAYWWWNNKINGGYIFITSDNDVANENKLPIFDLAPENISVTVNPAYEHALPSLNRVLRLYYYDFSVNENISELKLEELDAEFNRDKKIYQNNGTGLLNIVAEPNGIGTVVVNVRSTNTSIVDVAFDGTLIVKNIGECELIFTSALNSDAGELENRTIKVVVDYPIGSEFKLIRSQNNRLSPVGEIESLPQGTSKQYHVSTYGEKIATDGKTYSHKTKTNTGLYVDVAVLGDVNIEDYIQISGQTASSIDDGFGNTNMRVRLDDKTPFIVSVLKMMKDVDLNVTVTPFVEIEEQDVGFDADIKKQFSLNTTRGVSQISFSYDEAVVYPNDTVYLSIQMKTDDPLCANADGSVDIVALQEVFNNLLLKDETTETACALQLLCEKSGDILFNLKVDRASYDKTKLVQSITLRIEFGEISISNKQTMSLTLNDLIGDNSSTVEFVIFPQRIDKIEIKNYYYKNVGTVDEPRKEFVMADILKPNDYGRIVLDMVPFNAYYGYVEISDITGNEEIVFIQVGEDGKPLAEQDVSSDGKGIKLYPTSDNTQNLYVRTQISNTFASKTHTIKVQAYSDEDHKLGNAFTKQIDVKMLPEIQIGYVLPDGTIQREVNSTENSMLDGLYLANGVDAYIKVETRNADNVTPKISADDSSLAGKYNIEKESDNIYVLKRNNSQIVSSDLGKKIKITFTAVSVMDNGDFDETQCSIEFEIISFVIHDVSVNSSIDNANTKEIYGYYNRDVKLDFYFDKDDISYYNANEEQKFWNTEYKYYLGAEDEAESAEEKQIYGILKALNGYDDENNLQTVNDYLNLTLKYVKDNVDFTDELDQGNVFSNADSTQKVQLYQNILTVKEGYKEQTIEGSKVNTTNYLSAKFKLYYLVDALNTEHNGWKIAQHDQSFEVETDYYAINKSYELNFREPTAWENPEVVNTVEEFLSMESKGNYILNADLTLENYVPLDVDLVCFDGNGHTITINSFAPFVNSTIKAGLFAEIRENMIVKNVKVKYVSKKVEGTYSLGYVEQGASAYNITYFDICGGNATAFSEVKFGGLAAVNNGIITNCVVDGLVAMHASTLENRSIQAGSGYNINFNVGGLVCENTSKGYITNSSTTLSLFTLANVGGFVHSNAGTIASCGVEKTTTIYGYNNTLGTTINVEVAGFVVKNTGNISMSYVNMLKSNVEVEYFYKETLNKTIKGGMMSVKDISAGFVSNNAGRIQDAYVYMSETGVHSNRFAGFVNVNSGSIERAYTNVNDGVRFDTNDSMFAPAGTTGLINCIEIVQISSGYSNGIDEGLYVLSSDSKNDKKAYENQNFAFGDNINAVWSHETGSTPKLISTQEFTFDNFEPTTIRFEKDDDVTDGVDSSHYQPYYSSYGTKNNPFLIYDVATWNEHFNLENNGNNLTGYYRIVKDIDFSNVGNNPYTSNLVFKGNIQGNNMSLTGIMLYTEESLDSLGLFKKLEGVQDSSVNNAVRNLRINVSSVWASSTTAVGVLAGVIENFNLYNITIDAENVIMVGKNAVGGLAGIIKGEFDLDQISSNIGANSTRISTSSTYSIYMSKNNQTSISSNLSNVYYAGSVVGILDAYNRNPYNINNKRYVNGTNCLVRNINVVGNIVVAGDTAGVAFGFVGERVQVQRINIDVTGSIFGSQYSAGVVGENRGVIMNASVRIGDNTFQNAKFVMAGVVGLNLGGLVKDVRVEQMKVNHTTFGYSVGGIVGRNVYGTVANAFFNGEISAYFTGGIVAVDYDDKIFLSAAAGNGAINVLCKNNDNLVPKNKIEYCENDTPISHYSNVALSISTLQFFVDNSNRFYSYQYNSDFKYDEAGNENNLSKVIVKSKVLGLVVALSYENSIMNKQGAYKYKIEKGEQEVIFNTTKNAFSSSVELEVTQNHVLLKKDETNTNDDVKMNFTNVNVWNGEGLTITENHVMFIVGCAEVNSFDTMKDYSQEYVLILN